jgi:hypothetical protein
MTTKSSNHKIEPEFEDLFSFSNKQEKLEHRAQMISYRILSEVEKLCEEQNIKMKDLAAMVDTSASYITQLFRGNKQVNTAFMAKCEEAFEMLFEFSIRRAAMECHTPAKYDLSLDIKGMQARHPETQFYGVTKGGAIDKTDQFLKEMAEDQKRSNSPKKQVV